MEYPYSCFLAVFRLTGGSMCKECEARRKLARDALFNKQVGNVIKHVVKGAAEAVGLKEKTAIAETKEAAKPKSK